MNRRSLTILLPCATAVLVAGCSTFTDTDVVARVGDVELSVEELDELVDAADEGTESVGAVLPEGVADADVARQQISAWIIDTVFELPQSEIEEAYALGIVESGVSCPRLLLTETVEEAEAGADRIDSGESFESVLADINIDPGLTEGGGSLGCLTLEQLGPIDNPPPDVAALLAVDAASPISVNTFPLSDGTEAGIVVIHTPFDELTEVDAANAADIIERAAAQNVDVEQLDVHVNPRYGTFDPVSGSVVALG